MTTEAERQAANPTPPTQSTTPGEGVTWLATSTVATAHDLSAYPGLFNRRVELLAATGKIWISFGEAATPVIDKASVAGSTLAAGTLAAAPYPIANGSSLTVRLDRTKQRYMHVQADASTPTLIIRPASQTRG